MRLLKIISLGLVALLLPPPDARAETARIGVLAHRGAEAAEGHWLPLARYLDAQVAGWDFELVPVTLVSAKEKISARDIDLLITNPGHFTDLAREHPMSVLATLERIGPGAESGLLYYGTAVFARRDAGLANLGSLRGHSLAAVSPDAFGGFQMAWSEFLHEGVDVFSDLSDLRFMGFPQDEIVAAVARGEIDAGVVRSGLLESLDREGKIAVADFVVLNNRTQPDFPFQVTGHLYPEWPFIALASAPKRLREAVSAALLDTQSAAVRGEFGLVDAWSAPLPYGVVGDLVDRFRARGEAAAALWRSVAMALLAAALGAAASGVFAWRHLSRPGPAAPEAAPVPVAAAEDDIPAEELERFRTLTRRELEILGRVCAGEASKSIAEALGVSVKTVEFHRGNLLRKTGAGTTARLVQIATRLGHS